MLSIWAFFPTKTPDQDFSSSHDSIIISKNRTCSDCAILERSSAHHGAVVERPVAVAE